MRGALISLHVEKVTPLVRWIATPRKWCRVGGTWVSYTGSTRIWTLPA